MTASLLSTKFYVPPVRLDGVSRPRLIELITNSLKIPGSITLVSGPAGFGKTSLLSEFTNSIPSKPAWVSLDETDDDPIQFWSYFITACQIIQPEIGRSALENVKSPIPQPPDALMTSLINDLAELNQEIVLILDDFHYIQNESIHNSLIFLLEHLPAKIHLIISTRVDPPWPLARFRARNRMVEIRTSDLRFSPIEATSFLNNVMGLTLTPPEVEALEERTEGWIAGLQLAALSMKGRSDISSFIKAFTGSHIYIAEYLVEEVLKRQPEEVQSFLIRSSVLDQLNGDLCQVVTEIPNSRLILINLHRMNLFISGIDQEGQWFRFHHLFKDLLLARLRLNHSPEFISSLHHRASIWYEENESYPEAIEHSILGSDYSHLVSLIEKVALPMILQAYVRTLERWMSFIPQNLLEDNPKINLAFAWMNLLRGTFPLAMPYLSRLQIIYSKNSMNDEPSVLGEWFTLQSQLENSQGKPEASKDLANKALELLPATEIHVRSMANINLATAYQMMMNYDHAADVFKTIVSNSQTIGDFTFETLGTSGLGRMLLLQGRLHECLQVASAGIDRMEALGKVTPFGATLYGEVGQVYYNWHQLEQVKKYTSLSKQVSGKNGYSDPEVFNYITLSKIYQMEDDWKAAADYMEKATELSRLIPPALIEENIVAQQVTVNLAFGRLDEAKSILNRYGFSFDEDFDYPDRSVSKVGPHTRGLIFMSALRLLLAVSKKQNIHNLIPEGIIAATKLIDREIGAHSIPTALETLLIRSQLHSALGDESKEIGDIQQALKIAEPEGFISLFIEGGLLIARSLVKCSNMDLSEICQASFLQNILSSFPEKMIQSINVSTLLPIGTKDTKIINTSSLTEPLTRRELEVLQLIARGDSNQEIADKLVITISAVKKHSSSIFGKLAVNNRTQAVVLARQSGLINSD